MTGVPDFKNYSMEQLDKIIDQAKKEKQRIEKGASEMVDKVERMLEEHGVDFDEFVYHFKAAARAATPKRRKKKVTQKKATTKKATAKKAITKKATTKKATAKKTSAKKTAAKKKATGKKSSLKGRKIPPKYRNPDNASETWTGRGRQPKWVAAALSSGKSLDDLKI
jgi:DNA-binding protein H-NS